MHNILKESYNLENLSKKFKKDNAIVFNSAHGPFNSSYNHLKIIYYSIIGDIISFFGLNDYDNIILIDKKTILKKHDMSLFIS